MPPRTPAINATMSATKFNKFFNSVSKSVARGRGTTKSLAELMAEQGIQMQLPPDLERALGGLLSQPIPAKTALRIPHNCAPCGACGVCHLCSELNYGAGGAHAASIWHILDVSGGMVSR
jgi:hypothetical protein